MDPLIGTRQCPHLGFELQKGLPCCRADDVTRTQCGQFAPNPAARGGGYNVDPYFCTVLGTDALPAEALKLAAREKAQAREAAAPPKFQAPRDATGRVEALPSREQQTDNDQDPVIPTHTVRRDEKQVAPNAPCPCGSGKKFKKCCGRFG